MLFSTSFDLFFLIILPPPPSQLVPIFSCLFAEQYEVLATLSHVRIWYNRQNWLWYVTTISIEFYLITHLSTHTHAHNFKDEEFCVKSLKICLNDLLRAAMSFGSSSSHNSIHRLLLCTTAAHPSDNNKRQTQRIRVVHLLRDLCVARNMFVVMHMQCECVSSAIIYHLKYSMCKHTSRLLSAKEHDTCTSCVCVCEFCKWIYS